MTAVLFEFAIVAFVLLTALGTAMLRDVLSAIIVFAAYSLGMALLYAFLLAPDVGLTEAAIGAGVTTILLIVTLSRSSRPEQVPQFESIHWPAAIVVGAFVVAVAWTTMQLPPLGSTEAIAWANEAVTQHYLAMSYAETGVENTVTSVLAAYRGFDTFGEAVVVFTVAISVLLVLDWEVFA